MIPVLSGMFSASVCALRQGGWMLSRRRGGFVEFSAIFVLMMDLRIICMIVCFPLILVVTIRVLVLIEYKLHCFLWVSVKVPVKMVRRFNNARGRPARRSFRGRRRFSRARRPLLTRNRHRTPRWRAPAPKKKLVKLKYL